MEERPFEEDVVAELSRVPMPHLLHQAVLFQGGQHSLRRCGQVADAQVAAEVGGTALCQLDQGPLPRQGLGRLRVIAAPRPPGIHQLDFGLRRELGRIRRAQTPAGQHRREERSARQRPHSLTAAGQQRPQSGKLVGENCGFVVRQVVNIDVAHARP